MPQIVRCASSRNNSPRICQHTAAALRKAYQKRRGARQLKEGNDGMYKRRFFLPLLLILSIALLGAAAQAEDVYVVPGGQSVGVAVATEGLVVIGNSDLGNVPSPARLAGLRAGDRLLSLDGEEITSAEHLPSVLDGYPEATHTVARDG